MRDACCGDGRRNTMPTMRTADRDHLCIVLVRTRNPLNIGSVARIMSNFGVHDLRLVQPWEPSFREARSAVGASDLLRNAKVFNSVAEAIADCRLVVGTTAVRDRELRQTLEPLIAAAKKVRKRLERARVAMMFGSEKTGLSSDELSYCNLLLRIPTREEHVSLNLAQAVAVTLYEIVRDTKERTSKVARGKETSAVAADVERITEVLEASLRRSGYMKSGADATTALKLRRLIRRMNLTEPDATVLVGMLRKILWKIEHP